MESQRDLARVVDGALARRDFAPFREPGPRLRRFATLLVGRGHAADRRTARRAAEALGVCAATLDATDREAVRNLIRRLLWSMNDESGSIGWTAAHALGEILLRVPGLRAEYATILASFLPSPEFGEGAAHGVARLAPGIPGLVVDWADTLAAALDGPPALRAHAAVALAFHPDPERRRAARSLASDASPFECYDPATGEFVPTTVGAYVAGAVEAGGTRPG